MAERQVLPVPFSLVQDFEMLTREMEDRDLVYRLRRLVGRTYAEAWGAGHLVGTHEAYSDERSRQAQEQTEDRAAAKETLDG